MIAPTEKVRRPRVVLPDVHLHAHGVLFRELVAKAKSLEPIRMAVVHPIDRGALLGALQAAQEGLIIPVLVGPEDRIRSVAAAHDLDIAGLELIATEHSHDAAATAVQLARSGEVDALMRGSLHTDELMHAAVAPRTGLATDRRMSHVFVMDVPTYPRPLLITDAALNLEPDLDAKRDIVQNAIDLALAIGVDTPKVAILSAVETVNPKVRSSLDAAALAKMAERGQIHGGLVDGPLAFDSAVARGRSHEGHRLASCRTGRHRRRPGPREWQHARQAARLLRRLASQPGSSSADACRSPSPAKPTAHCNMSPRVLWPCSPPPCPPWPRCPSWKPRP